MSVGTGTGPRPLWGPTFWAFPLSRLRARLTSHGRHARLSFEGRKGRMQQDTERFILDLRDDVR
jgi:hypothetical protein